MNNYAEEITNIVKSGVSIYKISEWTGLKVNEIRKIMLENHISPSETDKEYKNYIDALKLKESANKAYFYKDLAKISGVPISRVKFLADVYDIKPTKKAYCTVCGKEIDLSNSTIVNKYCSKECSNTVNKPKKERKPIKKTCVHCNEVFHGKPNSKYCSELCKKLYNEVEETVRWLGEIGENCIWKHK